MKFFRFALAGFGNRVFHLRLRAADLGQQCLDHFRARGGKCLTDSIRCPRIETAFSPTQIRQLSYQDWRKNFGFPQANQTLHGHGNDQHRKHQKWNHEPSALNQQVEKVQIGWHDGGDHLRFDRVGSRADIIRRFGAGRILSVDRHGLKSNRGGQHDKADQSTRAIHKSKPIH